MTHWKWLWWDLLDLLEDIVRGFFMILGLVALMFVVFLPFITNIILGVHGWWMVPVCVPVALLACWLFGSD